MEYGHPLQSLCLEAAQQFPRECCQQLWNLSPNALLRSSFRSFFCARSMRFLSRQIEQVVLNQVGVTEVHVSFQSLRRALPLMDRYASMGRNVMGQWIYSAVELLHDIPVIPHTAFVNTEGTAFENFWWVIAYGPGISLCLIGEEIRCPQVSNRLYRGFYTCCESTTVDVLDVLRASFPDEVPQPVIRAFALPFEMAHA